MAGGAPVSVPHFNFHREHERQRDNVNRDGDSFDDLNNPLADDRSLKRGPK